MNIAIIGAGIGGLTSAIALHKLGHKITIYERHPQKNVSGAGAGIVLWPNAVFVLDYLGLTEAISANAGIIESMDRYTDQGELLTSLNTHHLNRMMKFPSYSILYKDLLEILFNVVESCGIHICYGHRLNTINEEGQIAYALFENNSKITADLMLGADGRMNSHARLFVTGDNTPSYHGFVNWVGFVESDKTLYDKMAVTDIWGIGKRFGIVPITDKKLYWAGAIKTEKNDSTDNALKQKLQYLFNGWPNPVQDIIANTDQHNIKTIYVHDLNPITRWYKNNVLLIGDAAHASLPTSGQGACQAIEDAWHLMNAVQNNGNSIELTLKEFNEVRLNKTSALIHAGRQLANSIFNSDPNYCQTRNEQAKNTDATKSIIAMANFWGEGLPI